MSNKRTKCQLLQNLYLTFLLNSKKGKNIEQKGKNVEHKGKNVKQKGKNVDFSKFLFDIYFSITKKGKNVEQFDIFVFDIFS